jgi:hypothetical protein
MRATYDRLGEQACSATLGGCLDYVGVADQARLSHGAVDLMQGVCMAAELSMS